jgi:hypothetical protein
MAGQLGGNVVLRLLLGGGWGGGHGRFAYDPALLLMDGTFKGTVA